MGASIGNILGSLWSSDERGSTKTSNIHITCCISRPKERHYLMCDNNLYNFSTKQDMSRFIQNNYIKCIDSNYSVFTSNQPAVYDKQFEYLLLMNGKK